MSTQSNDMEDAADDYLDGSDTELDINDPLSGLPVVECEKAYDFAGAPEAIFWKTLAQRPMSANDYVAIIKAGADGYRFEGFTSKEGKSFAARVAYNPNRLDRDGERSPGCEFLFDKPKELKLLCPISKKPIIEREKSYQFPGIPELRAWKEMAKRVMKPEEYCEVISKGSAKFEGFRSKNTGKKFEATLKFVKVSQREGPGFGKPAIEFDFPARD
jgi:hypothetical protein